MKISKNFWEDKNLIKTLKNGGVVVMPTDTIYGVVGRAEDIDTVKRIYKIRKRELSKPFIILIANFSDLEKFGILKSKQSSRSQKMFTLLKKFWPSLSRQDLDKEVKPISVILDCSHKKFEYLHRGLNTLAFRLPRQKSLRDLLKITGPLVAPSANIEGFSPSKNIQEAKKYFGNEVDPVRGRGSLRALATSNGVDLYIDGGEIKNKASKIIQLHKNGSVSIIRE